MDGAAAVSGLRSGSERTQQTFKAEAMSVVAATSAATRPDVPELLARARTIAGLARERAKRTEADRRVGEDMIARMRQADLFRIMQPQAYGGFEYGFDAFSEVVATIARGCGSTGWVYGLLASHQWLIACFPRAAQDEVWRDRGALAAGTYAPVGQDGRGGRRLPAVWHRQLLQRLRQCAVAVPRRHDSPAGRRAKAGLSSCCRTTDCIIDDNWHTMGLAGTGSKNIIARDVFVPAHRTLAFAELADATAPGMRGHPNPLYRQSFLAVLPITIVSPVLGMAEGALADFLAMAGSAHHPRRGGGRQPPHGRAHHRADARRRGERLDRRGAAHHGRAIWRRRYATAARGEPIGVDVRLRNRRDQAFCVRLLVQAIDALFLAAGGQGLFLDQPLQRSLARRARRRLPHQPQLGFHRQHVRAAHARPGAQGAILSKLATPRTSTRTRACGRARPAPTPARSSRGRRS